MVNSVQIVISTQGYSAIDFSGLRTRWVVDDLAFTFEDRFVSLKEDRL